FQKQSDRISLTQLQKLTGLSREGVIQGIKELGWLLKVSRLEKSQVANEYKLNLDTETGQLVQSSDQSENLTSQNRAKKVVQNSDTQNQIYTKPNMEKHKTLLSIAPDPRIKILIDFFCDQYQKRFSEKYHVDGGKEGKLFQKLLRTFELDRLKDLIIKFF